MQKRAFTLIELIIVVLIISLVGFLVFSEVVKQTKKPEKLTPLTIKSTLKSELQSNENIEFFCIQKNRDCYIIKNGNITQYKGLVNLGTDLELYVVDKDNQLVKLEEFGRLKDNKITFRYKLYANGSSSEMILVNSQGVFYLPTYFGKTQKVEDLDNAKELWIKSKYNLKDNGNYY